MTIKNYVKGLLRDYHATLSGAVDSAIEGMESLIPDIDYDEQSQMLVVSHSVGGEE